MKQVMLLKVKWGGGRSLNKQFTTSNRKKGGCI